MTVGSPGPVTERVAERTCPACGSDAFTGEVFCEACGLRLLALPAAAPDGAAGPERLIRLEISLDGVAAVSDRGRRRVRNEDAVDVAVDAHRPGTAVAVVCDGVGSTSDAHLAARAASAAALAVLEAVVLSGRLDDDHLAAACGEACRAARTAVAEVPFDLDDVRAVPPSTTLVAAVVVPGRAIIASVGDSRAYWLPEAGDPRVLTVDDSLAQEQIAEGVDPETAHADPDAHAITRWIGADAEPVEPTVTRVDLPGPGWLVVCTDGLWNYFPEPGALAELGAGAPDRSPLTVARAMVSGALARGGGDNITVAVIAARAAADGPITPGRATREGSP